ncbi:MAG: lysophospholipid acyltransferase family protein [Gaiellaceae bacterium]
MSRAFYLFAGTVSWPFVKLLRIRARGAEDLPPGGFVLAANHLSNFDPWALGMPLFPRRFLRFMAKRELYWPPLSWLLGAVGAFPVSRGEADVEAFRTAVRLVRSGEIVAMFPEGTRRRKGFLKRLKPHAHTGTARVALAAGAPLVPAAIKGTERLTRLGPLRVAYGRPLQLEDLAGRPRSEAARVATSRLMEEIGRLEESL